MSEHKLKPGILIQFVNDNKYDEYVTGDVGYVLETFDSVHKFALDGQPPKLGSIVLVWHFRKSKEILIYEGEIKQHEKKSKPA